MRFLLFLSLLMGFIQVRSQHTEDPLVFINLFDTTMTSGVSCFRIPAIVTAPNGDLIATIDERVPSCGDLKWSEDINIVMRRSTDNGDTWSAIEKVVDFPQGISASDPSMIVDKMTNEIFLFFNYMDHTKEKDVYYLYVMKSKDNGQTWEVPKDITSEISKQEWHNDFKFITSGRGIQTSSGELLHTMVNLENGLHVFGSNDHGDSWYLIDTPLKPANESKIVELTDSTWMVNSRVNGGGLRYVHTSTDKGLTWISKPNSSLVDPGCNGSIISVPWENNNDLLLFSNANSSESRTNMTVRYSENDGQSWSVGKTIYEGSAAYSSMTMLTNGEIMLFFEKDDYQKNVVVKFSLDWLLN